MKSALAAFVVALVAAALLTPLVRRVALSSGIVDKPGGRRVHGRQIPRLGGIAVAIAFFAPLLILFGLESSVAQLFFSEPLRIVGLGVGGLMVTVLGILDDVRGVRAWHKLWVQAGAALVAYFCGFQIDAVTLPFVGRLEMGIFAAPVTVLWIVAIINALNLIDGLDGLAAGIAFFVCVSNFVVGYINGAQLVVLLSAAIAGAIIGFLLYNFNPASIFMGDSGSMFLGFALATTSLLGAAVKSSTTVAILVPIVALGVPIMDTLFAMIRRFLERRPLFSPDRGHIHHRLLDLGITHRRAVLILYGASVFLAAGAIAVALGRDWEVGGALVVISILLVGLMRFIGYFENIRGARIRLSPPRSELAERLREATPRAIRRIHSAEGSGEVQRALEELARACGFARCRVSGTEEPALRDFEWHSTPAAREYVRDMIEHRFTLDTCGEQAEIAFAWIADGGRVSPHEDILLQLVVDACDQRVARRPSKVRHLRPVV